jgi:FAD/FMN-containing dehydrogenase
MAKERSKLAACCAAMPEWRGRRCAPKSTGGLIGLALLLLGGLAAIIAVVMMRPRTRQALVNRARAMRPGAKNFPGLTEVSNWGNYPKTQANLVEFEDLDTLRQLVTGADGVIARGNGRCYGDSALAPTIISTMRYNKFLDFDTQQGIIRCQAGVLLSEILEVILPQGWFLPVTPGTKLITVGGAIASDVHGKSQHKAGNFSDHVISLELMQADGQIVTCSKEDHPDLYWTTCGGMGLTGVIINATLRLIPVETAYFKQQSIKAHTLSHLMDLFEESEAWPYSVAWIDCLTSGQSMGRGILMRGNHARLADLTAVSQQQHPLTPRPKFNLNVPISPPGFVLNRLSMKIFNTLYYHKQRAEMVEAVVDYNSFFYPLDAVLNWNRLYGAQGFTQYQFILPKETSREGMRRILQRIVDSGMVSFLAVLKLYGQQNGYLPFAMEGYSLALDFPIAEGLFEFLDELDQVVLDHGGRLYLTKDVRMSQAMFKQSYPHAAKFIENVQKFDRDHKFRSYQSDRIGITS